MRYGLSLLFAAALPLLLAACTFIGAATMPDPQPDRIARVTTEKTVCAGVKYKYKILLTGRDYGMNFPDSDPIGVLLFGRWHESRMEGAVFVNALEGTLPSNAFTICNSGAAPSGSVRIHDKTLSIDLRWSRIEHSREVLSPFRFNGEYDLELLPDVLNPQEAQPQEREPAKPRPILRPVEGDTLGQRMPNKTLNPTPKSIALFYAEAAARVS